VHIGVFEGCIDKFHELVDEKVSRLERRVELSRVDIVAADYIFVVFFASSPRMSMSWRIDLYYNPDSFKLGVLYNLLHLTYGVGTANMAVLTQLWHFSNLQRKAVLVNYVPVQDVHFIKEKTINGLLDGGNGEEVS
jgi:hypothetical protein